MLRYSATQLYKIIPVQSLFYNIATQSGKKLNIPKDLHLKNRDKIWISTQSFMTPVNKDNEYSQFSLTIRQHAMKNNTSVTSVQSHYSTWDVDENIDHPSNIFYETIVLMSTPDSNLHKCEYSYDWSVVPVMYASNFKRSFNEESDWEPSLQIKYKLLKSSSLALPVMDYNKYV